MLLAPIASDLVEKTTATKAMCPIYTRVYGIGTTSTSIEKHMKITEES